jgi:hypothetical protein
MRIAESSMSHYKIPTGGRQPVDREAAALAQLPESVAGHGVAIPALPPCTDADKVGAWEEWDGVTTRLCWSLLTGDQRQRLADLLRPNASHANGGVS